MPACTSLCVSAGSADSAGVGGCVMALMQMLNCITPRGQRGKQMGIARIVQFARRVRHRWRGARGAELDDYDDWKNYAPCAILGVDFSRATGAAPREAQCAATEEVSMTGKPRRVPMSNVDKAWLNGWRH